MKNLRLAVKMIGGFTLVAAIVLVVGFFGWRGANNLGDHIHEVGGVRLPSIESLGSTELAVQELLTAQRTLMSAELSMQERQEEKDKFHEAREEIQKHWDRFSELPATAREKELSEKFKQQLQSWEDLNQEWLELTRRYEDTGILNPSQLESDLHQIRGDHYRAEVKVGNHIQNEEEFEGYDNPKTCNFGLWLQEKEFDNQDIQQILSEVQDPHNKFHETVSKIQDAIQAGNMEQARRLHQEDMQQASDQVFQHFEELLEVAESAVEIREEVNQMVVGPIQKEANQANSVLNELIEINAEISATSMQAADEDAAQAQWTMVIGVIVGTILALALGILLTLSITRRVTQGVGLAQAMSKGDFTNKLEIKNQDEVGQLSQALNEMVDSLSKMIQDISGGVETLASSSTELNTIAEQLAKSSESTAGKANSVATAAEEMSSNMSSVAAAMEQASTNVSTVASGSEEMSSTIKEIAQNAEKAKEITSSAVNQAQSASSRVNQLGKAAEEIGKVTETINSISSQTNLLALNATIEAARAGEAGKGFAVVANEIKELAQQTAEATGEIAQKIQGIQDSTDSTVSEIEEISKVINQVDEIVASIAAAVEEQTATTKEIAENVGQVSQGISEVNENVSQSSSVAGEVAKDITEVNESANEISNSSAQVQQSAGELSRLAEQLKEMVSRFKTKE